MKPYLISLLLLASGLVHGGISLPVIHHDLRVKVEPQDSRLQATDRLQLPKAVRTFEFMLHDGLDPRLESPAGRLLPLSSVPAGVPARSATRRPGGGISGHRRTAHHFLLIS